MNPIPVWWRIWSYLKMATVVAIAGFAWSSARSSDLPLVSDVELQPLAAQIRRLQEEGYGHYPICIAKTQYSFSTDPQLRAAPSGHMINIREVRLAAGAEFVVMVCGDVMTMPGLPKMPSAEKIDLTDDGKVVGLF